MIMVPDKKDSILIQNRILFPQHNITSMIEIADEVFLFGFGHDRTKKVKDTREKPRYQLL